MKQNADKVAAPRSRPRGRPRDPARCRRILDAARKQFYAHGLERASVDAIAAEAGVSKMTIYSNFASKEGLFEAVVRDRTEQVMGGAIGAQALDPMQPRNALQAVGEQFLALALEDAVLGRFHPVYGGAGERPAACLAFYRQGAGRLISDLATYLRRANEAGTLKASHARQAADLFLSMFSGDRHVRGLLMLEAPGAREAKALLREAVRVFMAAYGKGLE
jgi:AcrR family transcriptional regulator